MLGASGHRTPRVHPLLEDDRTRDVLTMMTRWLVGTTLAVTALLVVGPALV